MLNKITTASNYIERQKFVREAERMVNEYGWQEKVVHPYSYAVKVTDIIEDFKDYDRCTSGSKRYLVSLVNGLAGILNEWEKQEKEPKAKIFLHKKGEERVAPRSIADALVEMGLAEIIELI